MINLEQAYKEFEHYLDQFDQDNDRIKLKIVHTYGVVKCARAITKRMGLEKEDRDLAEIIALLHDIGRFEQVKRFNSFEPCTMDHASFGVELLFGDGLMIRRFIEDDQFDDIIRFSIGQHSLYKLEENADARMSLHAKLIRDADKLDNCRVKLEDSLDILLGMKKEVVGKQEISDKVWKSCLRRESVLSSDRITKMDYWVSYIAYFFDINFAETFSIIQEENYVRRIIDRIPYTNLDTQEKMRILEKMLGE